MSLRSELDQALSSKRTCFCSPSSTEPRLRCRSSWLTLSCSRWRYPLPPRFLWVTRLPRMVSLRKMLYPPPLKLELVIRWFHWGRYLFFRELLYGDNWAKDLLLAQLHFRGDPCQDSWPEKQKKGQRKRADGEVLILTGSGVLHWVGCLCHLNLCHLCLCPWQC